MTEFTHLWLFFPMVLGIIVLPGMDMAFVLASALAGGRRRGVSDVAGIVVGGICHTLSGVLGVGLLFKLVPGVVDTMPIVGALYIARIGVSLVRSPLGSIIAMTQVAVYGGLALAAGSTQGWLAGRQAAGLVIARVAGGMLLLGALVTAVGVVHAFLTPQSASTVRLSAFGSWDARKCRSL